VGSRLRSFGFWSCIWAAFRCGFSFRILLGRLGGWAGGSVKQFALLGLLARRIGGDFLAG
jgi:hypothetical protein